MQPKAPSTQRDTTANRGMDAILTNAPDAVALYVHQWKSFQNMKRIIKGHRVRPSESSPTNHEYIHCQNHHPRNFTIYHHTNPAVFFLPWCTYDCHLDCPENFQFPHRSGSWLELSPRPFELSEAWGGSRWPWVDAQFTWLTLGYGGSFWL